MLAAASRYVCGRVQQHIAESSSTDLGGPGMSRRHADNAQGGLAGKPPEKAQHALDPCVEGSHAYGTTRRRREHSSQGDSNDC